MNIAQPIRRPVRPQAIKVGEAIKDDVLGFVVSVASVIGIILMMV